MPYQLPTDTNLNFTQPDTWLVYVADQVPSFFGWVLFAMFMIVWLGGMFREKARTQLNAEPAKWFFIAGIGTLITALVLTIRQGLISLPVLTIVVVITIVGSVFYAISE